MICENCGKEHDGSYGSGRFCSQKCSKSHGNKVRNISPEQRQLINKKISDGVKKYNTENSKELIYYNYVCEKCGENFVTTHKIRKERKIHCDNCKRKIQHFKNIDEIQSIKELSKRTVTKILERANMGCSICGWNESTCDIHHIIERKNNGSDNMDNLILVCPNCHRVIHTTNKYPIEFLQSKSLDKEFIDWKLYYHISN